jgi:hypothetical protein
LWFDKFLAHLNYERNWTAMDAGQDSSNLADAAEQSIEDMIAGIDQTLLFIRMARLTDPLRFDLESWVTVAQAVQGSFGIAIADRRGILWPTQLATAATPIDSRGLIDADGSFDGIVVCRRNPPG